MSKMTMPAVDVVRFEESDVICASGGIIDISNLGNGETATDKGDGVWKFGTVTYSSSDISGNPTYFVNQFNSYFGTNFTSTANIRIGGRTDTDLGTLVAHDMQDTAENPSSDGIYNGIYRWNGSMFVKQ